MNEPQEKHEPQKPAYPRRQVIPKFRGANRLLWLAGVTFAEKIHSLSRILGAASRVQP